MGVVPPATPPSSVVSSQSSPTPPAGAFVTGFESDLEKGQYNEEKVKLDSSQIRTQGSAIHPSTKYVTRSR
jgi:hypothetical protein